MARFLAALLVGSLLPAAGQSKYDVSLVLAQARDRVLELTDRLPRYTCVQTVNRTYFEAMKRPEPGTSCDQFAGDKKRGRRNLTLEATDRLRLDVMVTEGHEIYSWAGASRFDSRDSADLDFIGGGPIGTGPFGTFLLDILSNEGATVEFQETTQLRGQTVLQYAYQVPFEASHYLIGGNNRDRRATAFSGSLWVNPVTEELERITVLTSELPAETGACTADTRVDYQRVRLGTGDFLLPLESELHFLERDGSESSSIASYAKCREYVAESSLSFGEPVSGDKATEDVAHAPPSIPAGLKVALALTAPIDTETASAGDAIAARVKHAVLDAKSRAVLIPAGAVVHGRIVRMEHRLYPEAHFLISISWAKIEDRATVAPFFARIVQMDNQEVKNRAAGRATRSTVWLPPPGESKRAGGWLILPTTKDRYVVPAGYTTEWMTATRPSL